MLRLIGLSHQLPTNLCVIYKFLNQAYQNILHSTFRPTSMALEPHCVATLPETGNFAKTLWILGCILSSIVYGILLVLAHSCFTALHKREHRKLHVKRGLTVYVLLVVVGGTAVELLNIKQTLYGVLDDTCIGAYSHVSHPYTGPGDIAAFLMTLLTDGVLVRIYISFILGLYIYSRC